jgi:hypothetical protein
MICAYCLKDPGAKSNGVWKGFRDADTSQLVCWQCQKIHYKFKFQNKLLNGLYSEFPVMTINPQLHFDYGQSLTN